MQKRAITLTGSRPYIDLSRLLRVGDFLVIRKVDPSNTIVPKKRRKLYGTLARAINSSSIFNFLKEPPAATLDRLTNVFNLSHIFKREVV